MPLLRRYWTYPTVETLYKEQSLLKSVTCFFHPDKNRKSPSPARLNSLSFHLARPCPSALCYLQSQSVPVIPLKGTTPEATQVWETVQCWPASPPPPLPAYFTSGSASHVRPHWWPSLYKSDQSPQTENIVTYFGILKRLWDPWEAFKGDSSTEKALVGCGSPREERSGSGGLNAPKSSQVTQLELFAGEEMSLIPNTFQHQYEASSFKIVLFKVNCTIWKKKLPSV